MLSENDEILFTDYKRHFADIQKALAEMIMQVTDHLGSITVSAAITGSGGLTLGRHLELPFIQEVIAVTKSLQYYAPNTDVAIELGGEDTKIIYFNNGIEQRMNGMHEEQVLLLIRWQFFLRRMPPDLMIFKVLNDPFSE